MAVEFKRSGWLSCPESVSVARFLPTRSYLLADVSRFSTFTCVTGSARDKRSEGNAVLTAWSISSILGNQDDEEKLRFIVEKQFQGSHPTSIADLQVVDASHIVTGDTSGTARLFQIQDASPDAMRGFHVREEFHHKHTFRGGKPAPITGVAVHSTGGDPSMSTCGEDGRVFFYRLDNTGGTTSTIERTSSFNTPLTCLCYGASREIIAGSSSGSLTLYDVRRNDSESEGLLLINSDRILSIMSVDANPSARHVIAAGVEDGSVWFWDLRMLPQPINRVRLHKGPVTGVRFHPDRPSELLTCSFDSSMVHSITSCRDEDESKSFSLSTFGGKQRFGNSSRGCLWTSTEYGPLEQQIKRVNIESKSSTSGFLSLDVRRDLVLGAREDGCAFVTQILPGSAF